ncbi:hypothetical protein QTH89_19980 [Variovorax sp. J22G21]|uniref:hypothetical protein n=1 Tax=Variovorax fucosicus TaxID=3053517 RepID=UPI00257773A5|nr:MULTISPECIES: hypothetical protein [unclassified Variovorax]MDM0038721.1 hypothetical protein [Variovorax sp. J22R193]MDM0055672.1 hypothetical protein [Variovorax sp. J22G47]MDM0063497.1 hypothetical protein [Variovorax sp. J22G21]
MNFFSVRRLFASLQPREAGLLGVLVLFTLLALFGPELPARAGGGTLLADSREWRGLPNAMDVLSNLPFFAIGLWGLIRLHWLDHAHERAQAAMPTRPHALVEPPVDALDCAWLFFAGLILTAAGSVFYHLQPDALRLAADRAGMAVAFSGLIGMAVCERISHRAGWPAAWFTLAAGLLAVAVYHETRNVMPWAVVQFGGMLLVLGLALLRPVAGAWGLRLGWVIFFYAAAKLFEMADGAIYEATAHLVSGHSLKHLTAALAALPVLLTLRTAERHTLLRHNSGAATATA